MSGPDVGLQAELARELQGPVPEAARVITAALGERFGEATSAVLFYGSCLRRGSHEGVLDFYVLVDDYRRAYPRRGLAWLNTLLAPNVFYLEVGPPDASVAEEPLRAKVAVMSLADFERAATVDWHEARVWARFAQPSRLTFARDEGTRDRVATAVAEATRTFVAHAPIWCAEPGSPESRFDAVTFFSRAFAETYAAELRSESEETIQGLFAAQPERHARVLALALTELAVQGDLEHGTRAGEHIVRARPGALASAVADWPARRRRSKRIAVLGLLKCVITFEGWARYGLWKLERHRGAPIEISERQRRHPLLLGWPVLVRLLRERTLR